MSPDYKSMIAALLGFVVLPLAAVGVAWLVRKARARGRRLFRDEPLARLRGLHPDRRMDHRWDVI